MILIIPLGGLGTRFKQSGYNKPKALINVMGKPILFWLLDNLDFTNIDTILIPYNQELDKYHFTQMVRKNYPMINFIFKSLEKNTDGAAQTILLGLSDLKALGKVDCPVLCVDGDNFFTHNIIKLWNGDNTIILFSDNSQEAIYSYAKIDNGIITDVKEKDKISKYASTGGYGFDSWYNLITYCQKIIDNNIRQKNEYYTSTVIREMIKDKYVFLPKIINQEDFICLGTPLHVRIFCNNFPKINALNNQNMLSKKRYCFDLDNTLVTYPVIQGDYETVGPIEKNINMVRYLKKMGNTIIIYTARRMRTHQGDVGKLMADIGKITFNTLDKFDIPYDEIYFGKPYADFYIDDLAISPFNDLEKELGFYQSNIDPRDFNQLSSHSIQIYRKSSTELANNLSGEIHYYKNIPSEIKDMFPIMIDNDPENKWYDMERINGIPVSKLYLAEELTFDQFDHIIGSIKRIHSCPNANVNKNVNIYTNYSQKLIKRYSEYNYLRFADSENIYNKLLDGLLNYEKNEMGKISIIHGDPVLTNMVINNFGKIKFIDMRGKLENVTTILGDTMYDWAKIYQSLLGYDEILEGKKVSITYKNRMLNHFENKFLEDHNNNDLDNLRLITQSLLFTLIPLHDNAKCYDYYNLMSQIYNTV